VTTSLTDGLVVVTNRVEHERDALAGRRREGNNTNHEWEMVYWLYCVLGTSLRYLNLVSALELLTTKTQVHAQRVVGSKGGAREKVI
jgi:hypothetical protein